MKYLAWCLIFLITSCQTNFSQLRPNVTDASTPVVSQTATIATTQSGSPTPSPPFVTPPIQTQAEFYPPTPTIGAIVPRPAPLKLQQQLPQDLQMQIYSLSQAPVAEEVDIEHILANLDDQVMIRRYYSQGRAIWDTALLVQMAANNAALASFGYSIATNQPKLGESRLYRIYHGGKLILDTIFEQYPISVNQRGDDFLLMVRTASKEMILSKDKIAESLVGHDPRTWPQYCGDDIMYATLSEENVLVFRNDRLEYQIIPDTEPAKAPLKRFLTYGEHWALEVTNHVIVDGQPVNSINGYERSYELSILSGKPLYFFEKSGGLGINYGGQDIFLEWDLILHDRCCSGGTLNPIQVGNLIYFLARKGEQWELIELEAIDQSGT